MAESERCDIAVWDVGGCLLGETRHQLTNAVRRDGPQIAIETGDWLGNRLAIGWPQRVIAKQAPTIAEALAALVAAHRPALLLIVGPAAAIDKSLRIGDVLIADQVIADGMAIPLGDDCSSLPDVAMAEVPSGAVGVGRFRNAGSVARVTTDWARAAAEAICELGVDAALIAVVTAKASGAVVDPPASRRPTTSRQAGRFLGKLLKGDWGATSSDPKAPAAVAKAIRNLIEKPRRD